jgi:hypothetical protein
VRDSQSHTAAVRTGATECARLVRRGSHRSVEYGNVHSGRGVDRGGPVPRRSSPCKSLRAQILARTQQFIASSDEGYGAHPLVFSVLAFSARKPCRAAYDRRGEQQHNP